MTLIILAIVVLLIELETRIFRVKVHYLNKAAGVILPTDKIAFTLGRHVFTPFPQLSRHHLAHEQQHVHQFYRFGVLPFLVLYLYNHLRYGYQNNPLEKEAAAAGRRQFLADHAQGRK